MNPFSDPNILQMISNVINLLEWEFWWDVLLDNTDGGIVGFYNVSMMHFEFLGWIPFRNIVSLLLF